MTIQDVNGIAKRVYDKSGLKDLRPDVGILQKRIGWDKGSRNIGEAYQVGVILRNPNGFTYPGAQTSATAATALKAARPMIIKQAQVVPFEMDLREQVLYAALSRAAKAGEGAFAQLTGEIFKGMKLSAGIRLEAAILEGQRSKGTVEAVTDLGSQQMDVTFTAATWRPGFWWAVGEGATFDSFTGTTKNNAGGALIVAGVKADERKVTFTNSGTYSDEVAAGDTIWFEGSYDGTNHYEMPGLMSQSGVLSGTSLGISTTTYSNWKGNQLAVDGEMSFDALEEACGKLRDRGAAGKLSAYFPNKTIGKLLSEMKAMRIIDSSYNPAKGKIGHKGLEFSTPEIGDVELLIHPFLAWSEFLVQDESEIGRVGSSDITFGVPGFEDEQLFRLVDGYNAAELQLFTDQAVINKRPNRALRGTGVTHSST